MIAKEDVEKVQMQAFIDNGMSAAWDALTAKIANATSQREKLDCKKVIGLVCEKYLPKNTLIDLALSGRGFTHAYHEKCYEAVSSVGVHGCSFSLAFHRDPPAFDPSTDRVEGFSQ